MGCRQTGLYPGTVEYMKYLDNLLHIGRITHTCRVMYQLLNACLPHEYVRMETEKAEGVLAGHYADKGRSCLVRNDVEPNPNFDLLIIVPVCDAEDYVEDCIISLLRQQTQYAFHVVVVDDGSTDGTASILHRFDSEPRITIVQQENKGVSAARNRGLQHIDARYVTFVDADDYLPPYAVESLLEKAYECNSDIVEGSAESTAGDKIVSHTDADDASYVSGYPWAKLIKASLFSKVGFPEGYRYEDTIVNFILCPLSHRKSSIEETVYYYRIYDGNFTSHEFRNYATLDSYWVVKRLLGDVQTLGIPFDNELYRNLLMGMKLSGPRMNSLDEDTCKAYFAAMCNLASQSFPDCKADGRLRELDKAVRCHDFTRYLLASYFI